MAHTYKFRPDDTEDERDVRKMRSEYNRREDRKIERMLIEIPVHFDLWMQGARTGWIHDVAKDGTWLVRMHHSQVKRLVKIGPEDQPYCKVL